ncbi:MAG TPA: hypothetical protein VKG25_07575 [Bryobacteraceae bacterium]|nr:hypothetical protein [Bryobacteraceae bacterium]
MTANDIWSFDCNYDGFTNMNNQNPKDNGLCQAVQPDGRSQRCIRFQDHPGPHQTFVAEWNDGDDSSRRRQTPVRTVAPPGVRRPPAQRQWRMRAR